MIFLFNGLSTEESAWLLGWIWSDGNMHKSRPSIQITFHQNDEELVEKFQNILGKSPVYYDKEYNRINIRFTSKQMYSDLLTLGCRPAKSHIIGYPKINNIDFNTGAFLRGVFEGDGSVSFKYNNNVSVSISTGSLLFAEELQNILLNHDITSNITTGISPKSGRIYYKVIINGKSENRLKFYQLIYGSNPQYYLSRKYEKFTKFWNTHSYKLTQFGKRRILKGKNQNYFP